MNALVSNTRTPNQISPRPLINADDFSPPVFPLDALGVLAAPAKAMTEALQVSEGIAGMCLLSAASLVAQAHVDVEIHSRRYPTSLFALTVAESGERKSQADRFAMQAHHEWESAQRDACEANREAEDLAREIWNSKLEKIKRKALEEEGFHTDALLSLGKEPRRSPDPTILVSQPTFEGLVQAYKNGTSYKGLFNDDAGSFFGGYSMKQDNIQATIAGISRLWDGSAISKHNAAEGQSFTLEGRRLSSHLMIQPVIAKNLFSNPMLSDQGFLPRFIVTWPRPKKGSRLYQVHFLAKNRDMLTYWERMKTLLNLPIEQKGRGQLSPRPLPLSEDALQLWISAHDSIESELGEFGEYSQISAFGAKAAEIAARIAAVLAFCENHKALCIDTNNIASGIAIVRHSLATLKYIKESSSTSSTLLDAERLRKWILNKTKHNGTTSITKTEIMWSCSLKFPSAVLEKHLNTLVEYGWLCPLSEGAVFQGKLIKKAWSVAAEPA